MWKVNLPDNSDALYDLFRALTYADGDPKYALSTAEWKIIENIFDRYETLTGQAHDDLKGIALNDDAKNAIHDAYGEVQDNNRLEYLRSRILLAAGLCPRCSISAADELDHHLPRSVFKPLSTYSSNLTPICHKCNNKKRTVTGVDPNERFTHVYYDDIPIGTQFLTLDVTIQNNSLQTVFSITEVPGMSDTMFNQLSFQIKRINLNDRLTKEINDLLFSACNGLIDSYSSDYNKENVKRNLSRTANQFSMRYGLNDWRYTLLKCLSENDEFCDGGFMHILNYKVLPTEN